MTIISLLIGSDIIEKSIILSILFDRICQIKYQDYLRIYLRNRIILCYDKIMEAEK